MNNQNRTVSILQRAPVILAVTAASYGLDKPQAAATAKTSVTQPRASEQNRQAAPRPTRH